MITTLTAEKARLNQKVHVININPDCDLNPTEGKIVELSNRRIVVECNDPYDGPWEMTADANGVIEGEFGVIKPNKKSRAVLHHHNVVAEIVNDYDLPRCPTETLEKVLEILRAEGVRWEN